MSAAGHGTVLITGDPSLRLKNGFAQDDAIDVNNECIEIGNKCERPASVNLSLETSRKPGDALGQTSLPRFFLLLRLFAV